MTYIRSSRARSYPSPIDKVRDARATMTLMPFDLCTYPAAQHPTSHSKEGPTCSLHPFCHASGARSVRNHTSHSILRGRGQSQALIIVSIRNPSTRWWPENCTAQDLHRSCPLSTKRCLDRHTKPYWLKRGLYAVQKGEMSGPVSFSRNETNRVGENIPQGPETRATYTMLCDCCLPLCKTPVNTPRTERMKNVMGSPGEIVA